MNECAAPVFEKDELDGRSGVCSYDQCCPWMHKWTDCPCASSTIDDIYHLWFDKRRVSAHAAQRAMPLN